MEPHFGPAGNAESFYACGLKDSVHMPGWLQDRGLTAYEYQCSRGVHVGEATARRIGQKAASAEIVLSIHAPFFINMATDDVIIRQNSKRHMEKSLQVASWMGAGKIVFHPGGTRLGREVSLNNALRFLDEVLGETEEYKDVLLAPETMGKRNQLGSDITEVLTLCKLSPRVVPTVDFAHFHAMTGGGLITKSNYLTVLWQIGEALGDKVLQQLHIHFSPIEFTKAGEKRHRTFLERDFGPPFAPLAEAIIDLGLTPTIICESAGRQAEDALIMKQIYAQKRMTMRQSETGSPNE
jgi:deoxyribonuclease-4